MHLLLRSPGVRLSPPVYTPVRRDPLVGKGVTRCAPPGQTLPPGGSLRCMPPPRVWYQDFTREPTTFLSI